MDLKQQEVVNINKKTVLKNPDVKVVTSTKRIKDFLFKDKLNLTFVYANSKSLEKEVYATRYRAFESCLNEKIVAEKKDKKLKDEFDGEEKALNFLIKNDGHTVGTVRIIIHLNSKDRLPCFDIYPEVVQDIVKPGKKIIEITRLGIIKKTGVNPYSCILPVFKLVAHISKINRITDMLIAIRKSHAKLYEQMLLFERKSEERVYPLVNYKPILMHLDLEKAKKEGKPSHPKLYQYLFEEKIDILNL